MIIHTCIYNVGRCVCKDRVKVKENPYAETLYLFAQLYSIQYDREGTSLYFFLLFLDSQNLMTKKI